MSDSTSATGTTYVHHEYFLGLVYGVMLDEEVTEDRVTRVSYELNVIDGWVLIHEWTDESGIVWLGESRTPSRVRTVLDAAPRHAKFIANSHLTWVGVLRNAGHARQAGAQRRALTSALARHGLRLTKAPPEPA